MVADTGGGGFNPYGPGGPFGGQPPGAPSPGGFGAPPPGQQGFGAPPPPHGGPPGGPGAPGGPSPYGQPGPGFPPPGGGFTPPDQQHGGQPGYGQPSPGGYGAPPQGFGQGPGYGGGAIMHGSPQAGGRPVGKTRNPVMTLVLCMVCFVYTLIEGAAMLKELKAFRGKDDINLIFFLIPILNIIQVWNLPPKVLEAKQLAGVPNAQVVHPVLYLLLGVYFLPADLNEVWQAAGGGQR